MEMQPLNLFEMFNKGRGVAREDQKRNALSKYLQPAIGGDAGALSQIYGADPDAGLKVQGMVADQQKAQADALKDQLAQVSAVMASGGDEYASQMYPQWREMMQKATGTQLPEQYDPGAMQVIQHIAGMKREGAIVGNSMVDKYSGDVMFTGQPQRKLVNVPDGQGGFIQKEYDGQGFYDPNYGGAPSAAAMPAPTTGGGQGALENAVMQVESGGNPNAVSPKGAVGTMQTMPGTLRDPGFGVMPARDNSPAEQERVGKDYLNAMLQKYADPRLALAAYNAGPGRVDQAVEAAGGNVDAALARLPAETRAYVPNVLGRAQGGPQAASGPRLGYTPPKPAMTEAQRLSAENAAARLALAQRNADRADKLATTQQQAQRSKPMSGDVANKVGLYDNGLKAAQSWVKEVVNPDGTFNDIKARMPGVRSLLNQAVRAKLRAESGAAISEAELDGEVKRYMGGFVSSDAANARMAQTLVNDLAHQRDVLVQGRTSGDTSGRQVVRTGMHNGRKVVQYSDGTTDYAD